MANEQQNQDTESVSQVDSEQLRQQAAEQADSKEQQEFFEEQAGVEEQAQGYGH